MWNMIITFNISAIHLQMCPIYILPSSVSPAVVPPWHSHLKLVQFGQWRNLLPVALCWQIGTALQYFQFTLAKARIMKQMKQIYFFITNIFLYNKYFLGLLPLPGTWGASWRAEQQTDPLPVLGPMEQMVTPVVFTKPNCKPLLLFRYKYQPLDHIRDYFGEQIAIYFAWLGEFLSLDYNISFRESCYTLVCNNLQLFQL